MKWKMTTKEDSCSITITSAILEDIAERISLKKPQRETIKKIKKRIQQKEQSIGPDELLPREKNENVIASVRVLMKNAVGL